jgi:hypothetical protein
MTPSDRDAPGSASGEGWTTVAVALVAIVGVAQIAYGAAAIGGLGALEDNLREIEANVQFGHAYLSLGAWGVLLVVCGLAELGAALAFRRGRPHARLFGLCATLIGMVLAFFTLAIFRVAALITLAFLFAALYVLSYRVSD